MEGGALCFPPSKPPLVRIGLLLPWWALEWVSIGQTKQASKKKWLCHFKNSLVCFKNINQNLIIHKEVNVKGLFKYDVSVFWAFLEVCLLEGFLRLIIKMFRMLKKGILWFSGPPIIFLFTLFLVNF